MTKALWSDKTRAQLDNGHAKGKVIVKETALTGIGIPLQSMLMRIGATVALVHRQTHPEVKQHFLEVADIVVTAFPASCEEDLVRNVKPGAVVIDCSAEGNLHPEAAERAAYVSTHDNHLGQITTALALYNTALCALWQRGLHKERGRA